MKAFLALRSGVHYRREAFANGLERLGYSVVHGLPLKPGKDDVLVIWNRYGDSARAAERFESAGRPVFVAENGYLGNDFAGGRWYALSLNQHNGAGFWKVGGPERWDSLGKTLPPWRCTGSEVVILPQRGIGPRGVAMPLEWPQRTLERLRKYGFPVRIRPHPGIGPCVPLLEDLADAKAVVTWGSGAALKALMAGVPTFADMPGWIGSGASLPVLDLINARYQRHGRTAMFRRLAWAMWRLDEIANGAAFAWLLNRNR